MTQSELIADQIQRSFGMLTMTLADFSDAEILMRPVPGANNVAWQLGHLVAAETMMLSAMKPGAAPELPAGFADKFNKETRAKPRCWNHSAKSTPRRWRSPNPVPRPT
jgi:hypothetical protein